MYCDVRTYVHVKLNVLMLSMYGHLVLKCCVCSLCYVFIMSLRDPPW